MNLSRSPILGFSVRAGLEGPALSLYVEQVARGAVAPAAVHAADQSKLRRINMQPGEILERGGAHVSVHHLAQAERAGSQGECLRQPALERSRGAGNTGNLYYPRGH